MKPRQFLASFLAVSLAGGGPAAAAVPGAAGASIGVAGAVKGLVRAIPHAAPKSVGRVVESGKPLYLNEHVTTGPGGHLQIMLKDETIFTIGPNSDIVLDEFFYNPETDAGKVTASVTKGVFRFITGNIGKKDPSRMEVKLPAGTIGIRGTIVAGQVRPDGVSMAVLLGPGPAASGARVGAFNLSNSEGSVFVEKPGFGSTIRTDTPPTPPALIPADQMKVLLGDLTPRTMAQRAEDGKQMLAERLAQKMAAGQDGPDGEESEADGPNGRPANAAGRRLAEKMATGEELSPEELALAREGMEKGNMTGMERELAEKMIAGEDLTAAEEQRVGMMIAGEQMMEQMDPSKMTPEQRLLAEKMMTGEMSPEQHQQMMTRMSPEQQSFMGEMMPAMDMMHFEGGDPNAMLGGVPKDVYGEWAGMPSPYGGLDMYDGTPEFFNALYDPRLDPNLTAGYIPPPTTGGFPDGPATWEAIRSQVVSGTGYFPGRTGNFNMVSCGGGACPTPTGTWGFSNMTVDFGAKTITGGANITVGGPMPINDTAAINVDFAALSGGAFFNVAGDSGFSNYAFQLGNAGGKLADVLQANARYDKPPTADVHGSGDPLVSNFVPGTAP